MSDFQIFMTFCQNTGILSVHMIYEILFDSNKKIKHFPSATHIFNPPFEIPVNKNLTLFLFDSNKIRFQIPIKALPVKALSTKNKTKMFRPPFRASETNSSQNGFALSVCHIVISKVPRHLYSNPKPYCRFPTISAHNPFLRDCP